MKFLLNRSLKILGTLALSLILLFNFNAQAVLADTTPPTTDTTGNYTGFLNYLQFISDADNNVIVGDTNTINFRLLDNAMSVYRGSGPFTATIFDPNGNKTMYSLSGSTSVSNVTFDTPGDYTIYVTATSNTLGLADGTESLGVASGTIHVRNAKISTSGDLTLNYSNTVKVTLTDSDGTILPRKSVTVDATNAGGTTSTYTTLYDGTFDVTMTPTKLGKITVTHGSHDIGTINVASAYASGTRIGNNASDNADRSVAVSEKGWSTANAVVLTRDDVVADAMVAVPLAKKQDAPILMTPSNELKSSVADEILRLNAKTVYIIGGEGAISSSVERQLQGYGITTNRIAGSDRYETAAKVASLVGSPGTVYLAYGYGEPDALAASALAAEQGIPILLTDTNTLPDSTRQALATLAPRNLKLLGGTGVISTDLQNSLTQNYGVERWGGVDRYATEQMIFQSYFANQHASNNSPAYFASANVSPSDVTSGTPYGDALFAAALAAKNNGFVITLPSNEIPSSISTFLLYNKAFIPSSTVVGNNAAISYQLEAKLNQLLAK